jgi:Spy/CpxP family protein refolding chaperone
MPTATFQITCKESRMSIHKTVLAASMVAFGLLGQPVLSHAHDGMHSSMPGHGCDQFGHDMKDYGFERMADRLNMSAEQRQAMQAIDAKFRPEMLKLRQVLKDNRDALDKMDASDPKLQELAEAQGKTMADMTVLRKKMRSQMDQVLTDAQRRQLQAMFKYRSHHHGWYRGIGHG